MSNGEWKTLFSLEATLEVPINNIQFASVLHAVHYYGFKEFEDRMGLTKRPYSKFFLEKSDGTKMSGIRARTLFNTNTAKAKMKYKEKFENFWKEWMGTDENSPCCKILKSCLDSKFTNSDELKKLLKESKKCNLYLSMMNKRFTGSSPLSYGSLTNYIFGLSVTDSTNIEKCDYKNEIEYHNIKGVTVGGKNACIVGKNVVGKYLMYLRETL